MADGTSVAQATLPPLIFGDRHARPEQGFHGMVDQFAHLTPGCDYDSKARRGFVSKGNRLDTGSLVINQNYYSHMLAVSAVRQHNILIPLAGTHNGLFQGNKLTANGNQGFFIPANDRFQFETGVDEIAGSLIVTYDPDRLNRVIRAMTASEAHAVSESCVRELPLTHGAINFKQLFIALFAQVDGVAGDVELLRRLGFDDQFYRILAMCVRPGLFRGTENARKSHQAARRTGVVERFEDYVEACLDKPLSLSELEAELGVSARALQYACLKKHGCSPRAYIRNRKLDWAHERLRQHGGPFKLAGLAFELGFSSQSQFTKYFRERFGVLPSAVAAGRDA